MIIILPDLEGGGNVGNFEPLTGTYQNEQIWTPNQQPIRHRRKRNRDMSPYGTRSKTKPETGSGRLKSRNYEDYVVYSDLENREDEESEWSGSSSEISDQPRKSKKAVGRSRPTIRRKANDTKDSSAARNTWTAKEDGILAKLVQKHGPKKWGLTAGFLPRRNAKQCHQRWHYVLQPAIARDPWTKEEDRIVIFYHKIHHNKWSHIAKHLPGRTGYAVRNRWGHLRKHLDKFPPMASPPPPIGKKKRKGQDAPVHEAQQSITKKRNIEEVVAEPMEMPKKRGRPSKTEAGKKKRGRPLGSKGSKQTKAKVEDKAHAGLRLEVPLEVPLEDEGNESEAEEEPSQSYYSHVGAEGLRAEYSDTSDEDEDEDEEYDDYDDLPIFSLPKPSQPDHGLQLLCSQALHMSPQNTSSQSRSKPMGRPPYSVSTFKEDSQKQAPFNDPKSYRPEAWTRIPKIGTGPTFHSRNFPSISVSEPSYLPMRPMEAPPLSLKAPGIGNAQYLLSLLMPVDARFGQIPHFGLHQQAGLITPRSRTLADLQGQPTMSPTSSPMSVGGYLRKTQPYGPFGSGVARGMTYEQQGSPMAHHRFGV